MSLQEASAYIKNRKRLDNEGVCYEFCLDGECGSMVMTRLFPGVRLAVNDFRMHRIPADRARARDGLLINCCLEGRCRVDLGNGRLVFLEANEVSVDTQHARDFFLSPTGRYLGVEIFMDFTTLRREFPQFFTDLAIDPFALRERLCTGPYNFVERTPPAAVPVLARIAACPEAPLSDLRLLLACCLKEFEALGTGEVETPKTWLTSQQTKIAQAVEMTLREDLARHVSIGPIARDFGVSESSLRDYFKGMYGESPAAYLRRLRVERASSLLVDTDETVGAIALMVGYENQSKFAAVFKAATRLSPLEYRRRHRLDNKVAPVPFVSWDVEMKEGA